MLQPLAMEFENPTTTTNVDAPDESNGDHLSGPAPTAPMAPMAPTMTSAPTAPMDPMRPKAMDIDGASSILAPVDGVANGVEDSPQAELIDEKKGEEEEKEDEDQIAYEPIKTPSKTPRYTRSRANLLKSRTSSWLAESELPTRQRPSRKSARKRRSPSKSKSPEPSNLPAASESSESPNRAESIARKTPAAPEKSLAKLNFEIVINPISPEISQQYTPIAPGDEIYRVLERIPTGVPGETWLSVEFEDGRIDQVSPQAF